MKTVLLILGILLLIAFPAKAQWIPYSTGVGFSLFSVDFYDDDLLTYNDQLGLAVGEGGTVLRTTDAGEEWTLVYQNLNIWLNDVKWATPTVAYAAGMGGVIVKTVDAGITWTVLRPFDTPMHTFRGIGIAGWNTPDHVFFVGYAGTFFETTNGGASFIERTDIPYTMHSIDFAHNFTTNGRGIITGTGGLAWNTTSGGALWVQRNTNRYDYLNDVIFVNDDEALVCGNNGTVLNSTNWGRTWTVIPQFTTQHLRSIDFNFSGVNKVVTVCGDNGTVYTSTNSGSAWTWNNASPVGEIRHFYGVCLNGPQRGTIVGQIGTGVGNAGMMYNTFNNGAVSITGTGTSVPKQFSLNQNFPNPFNPVTKISFSISKAGPVMLTVFDMTGREVAVLVNKTLSAGNFEYEFDGSKLSSGVYFYRIITNDFVDTKKMSLVK